MCFGFRQKDGKAFNSYENVRNDSSPGDRKQYCLMVSNEYVSPGDLEHGKTCSLNFLNNFFTPYTYRIKKAVYFLERLFYFQIFVYCVLKFFPLYSYYLSYICRISIGVRVVVVALTTSIPSAGVTCGSPLFSIETVNFNCYKKTLERCSNITWCLVSCTYVVVFIRYLQYRT